MSSEVYSALISAFTCTDTSHTSHSAAVGIQNVEEDSGQRDFDMAIAYMSSDLGFVYSPARNSAKRLTTEMSRPNAGDRRFMHLQLEARATNPVIYKGDEFPQLGSSLAHIILSEEIAHQTFGEQSSKLQSQVPDDKGPRAQILERPTTDVSTCHDPAQQNQSISKVSQENTVANLCSIDNCCEYMRVKHDAAQLSLDSVALGFVSGPRPCRHSFVIKAKKNSNNLGLNDIVPVPSALRDLIAANDEDEITLDFQLEIALKVATAALQFHSTPWLRNTWDMSDLCILEFIPQDLSNIHLYLQAELPMIGAPAEAAANPPGMDELPGRAKSFSLADYHGINNMILFSLGIALIEIGHWRQLIRLRIDSDPDGIPTARRFARRPTPLGGAYQEIIQRCLQCNFGYGTDLERYELQDAVYANVVCPLEKLRQQSQKALF